MAVLVEGISVIIRADRLLEAFAGDLDRFKSLVPNNTLCTDGELVRVGFLSPSETERFCNTLEHSGLFFREGDGQAKDFTVCDQQRGMMVPTRWASFGHIRWQGATTKRVAGCQLEGSSLKQLVTPDGWVFEGSLTKDFRFLPIPPRPQ